MGFRDNIKARRLELGLTTEDVARIVGVSNATISRWETGVITNQRRDKLKLLADALRTTPAQLMGWSDASCDAPPPTIAEDVVSFPILGDVAAGYGHIAAQDWTAEKIDVPRSYLKGRPASDYFALRVKGDSMFPAYQDGDVVLVLRQEAIDRSGQIGVVIYDDDNATLKKIEYAEDWLKLVPVNPNFPPVTVKGEQLEHCRILGVPRVLIREVVE